MAVPFKYRRKVIKVGNSYMVAIPSIWCKANALKKAQQLNVAVWADKIVITK